MRAAKKYRIVPVGFVTQQLRAQASPELPGGVLNLLFVDIEDSTGHLRRLVDRYTSLLTDVRTILRAATRRSGGHEVDARADEFFAVFASASSAVDAALAAQRAMRDRAWPDNVPVRVRIGIHRGRPTRSDGGYVGLAVNTAARICEAGHGGQTLISAAAAEAVEDELPPRATIRSIGSHRLRGMREAQPLLQLEADDLEATFPPLRIGVQPGQAHRVAGPAGLAHHLTERVDGGVLAD
jgi:class 3 adenylate cyclase